MGWKDSTSTIKGLIIGGSLGGLIVIIGIIILTVFLVNGIPLQPGSKEDIELMLFIIALGVILGSFLIGVVFSAIGALLGFIYGKLKQK